MMRLYAKLRHFYDNSQLSGEFMPIKVRKYHSSHRFIALGHKHVAQIGDKTVAITVNGVVSFYLKLSTAAFSCSSLPVS